VFETDISDHVDLSFFDGEESATLRTITTAEDVLDLRAHLPSVERLAQREIVRRVERGDALIVATLDGLPVGSMWVSFVSGVPLAFNATWSVAEHEAVRYDSYVLPAYRGRRIHSLLNHGANCLARGRGAQRTLAAVSSANRQSLKLPKQNQRKAVMSVWQIRLRGQQHPFTFATGRKFHAHFAVASPGPYDRERPAEIVKKQRGNQSVTVSQPSDVLNYGKHASGHRPSGLTDGNSSRARPGDAAARPGGGDDRGRLGAEPYSQ